MISLENVYKNFSGEYALEGISFDVAKGEVLGFLGPNGAGKTTTMRILTGVIAPTSGSVSIAGMDILKNPMEIKKLIGYMPENNPLYTDLTVREYLTFRGKIKGVRRAQLKDRIDYVAEQCMLHDVIDRLIGVLSKGYRQRVGLAETLIHDPKVLILDEPTVGLDPSQIRQVRELIKNLGKDRTVILSTHILPEVEATCSRVVIISNGKIRAVNTTSNLTKMHHGMNKIRLELKNNLARFESFLRDSSYVWSKSTGATDEHAIYFIEVEKNIDIREELFTAVVKNQSILLSMYEEKVTLEDIFIKLITDESNCKEDN